MKKVLLLILISSAFSAFSQTNDTLIVSKLNDAEYVKTYPNGTKFKLIKLQDGSVLGIGDKMKFGKPSSTNNSIQTTPGLFGSTNQSVNNFSYIMLGRMGSAILGGITFLPETFKGREAEIEEIKFSKAGKKAINAGAMIIFNNPGMDITVLNLGASLEYGELINPKAAMTSDQALAELQKAKTKLDLGVITQEEYDAIKKDLMKIIK